MPALNGLDAGRQAKEMLPAVKFVYLSMHSDAHVVAEDANPPDHEDVSEWRSTKN